MDEKNKKRLAELEALMESPDFCADKDAAQELVREYQQLKTEGPLPAGRQAHDSGNATLSVLAGAGGDDAEGFARMLPPIS